MALKIINHKNLLGRDLYGSGKSGSTKWKVTSIMEHLMHYVIFLEQEQMGWERKVTLHKHYETNQTGFQYKLECGAEHLFLVKDSIKNIDIFSNQLESFL